MLDRSVINALSISVKAVTAVAIMLAMLDLLDWIPNPRAELSQRILDLKEDVLPLTLDHVDIFLREMVFPKEPAVRDRIDEFKGIVIEDLFFGASRTGTVYLEHASGKRLTVCSFDELSEWAHRGKALRWTS